MTKAEAKKLCVKKWEWLVKNFNEPNADMDIDIPEIKDFNAHCAYCEKYQIDGKPDCIKCPIVKTFGIDENCFMAGSTFAKSYWSLKETKKMLKLIKQT